MSGQIRRVRLVTYVCDYCADEVLATAVPDECETCGGPCRPLSRSRWRQR